MATKATANGEKAVMVTTQHRGVRNGRETFRRAFPEARSLWETTIKGVGRIEAFWLGKTIVLIQDYHGGDGWNAFTPTTDAGRIDETLRAIAERCHVEAHIDSEPVAP